MRHLPEQDIRDLGDISFDSALAAAQVPCQEYDVNQWLFVPNHYTEYRYLLGTRGKRPLVCVGINPSTARPNQLDPTLKSVERIALGNGYDSCLMFNVYAQRATDPDDMEQTLNEELHRENMKAFACAVSQSDSVWAAWGTVIEKRAYLKQCVEDMIRIGVEHGARWYSCGRCSKKGHPHHPLYLRSDEKLNPFDVEGYLSLLA